VHNVSGSGVRNRGPPKRNFFQKTESDRQHRLKCDDSIVVANVWVELACGSTEVKGRI